MSTDTFDARSDIEAAWAAHEAARKTLTREYSFIAFPCQVSRMRIFESQNYRCCYCGVRMYVRGLDHERKFARQEGLPRWVGQRTVALLNRTATIEHIIRRADGGKDTWENVAAACHFDNNRRDHHEAMVWFEQVQWLKARGEHPNFPR